MVQMIVLIWFACKLEAPWWIYVLIGLCGCVSYYNKFKIEADMKKAIEILEDM